MGKIFLGVNNEFIRHEDKNFEYAVKKAAEIGYDYCEPMVHLGRELLSEAGYFHSVSMFDDPLRIKRACARAGVKLSGLSAHTPITKPEIGTEYLKQAIRFAAECGAPVVNTDEGPKPNWTTEEEDFVLMRYTLMEAAKVAEPRGILIGLECHQQYSKHPDGLDRIQKLVKSPQDTASSGRRDRFPRVSRPWRVPSRRGRHETSRPLPLREPDHHLRDGAAPRARPAPRVSLHVLP